MLASLLAMSLISRPAPTASHFAISAVLMGMSINAMHYTGMEAAHFQPGAICLVADAGISQDLLAGMVTVTALLLTIATLVAVYGSRLEDRSRILAASLATSAEHESLYLH